jgi:hypothetical protein
MTDLTKLARMHLAVVAVGLGAVVLGMAPFTLTGPSTNVIGDAWGLVLMIAGFLGGALGSLEGFAIRSRRLDLARWVLLVGSPVLGLWWLAPSVFSGGGAAPVSLWCIIQAASLWLLFMVATGAAASAVAIAGTSYEEPAARR